MTQRQDVTRRRTRRWLVTIGVAAALLFTVSPAPAQAAAYTDALPVTFASDEDNTDHYLYWNHFVHFQQWDQYHARTRLEVGELNRWAWNNDTDFVWFAGATEPGTYGIYNCRSVANGRCNRARVIFKEDLTRDPRVPGDTGFFLACHEFGHGYGFEHLPAYEPNCMSEHLNVYYPHANGVLAQYNIDRINAFPW
jgi:hypothetical protein